MESITNNLDTFITRKEEHITLSLHPDNEATGLSGLDTITLIHEALPNLDLADIDINTCYNNLNINSPFLVSSMTAGHAKGQLINENIAKACTTTGWMMGIGSQRRQLFDAQAQQEWIDFRKKFPTVKLFGNIGIAQIITHTPQQIQEIMEIINPVGVFIHANPLQETLQENGTPNYHGWYEALETLLTILKVPVILKETGCGFSAKSLQKLNSLKQLYAVDVSGLGGTHWGRIEGARAKQDQYRKQASITFANWGISTVDSLLNARQLSLEYEIWASGGIRNGLDAAKLIALGANIVGFAKPILERATDSAQAIIEFMQQVEFELKTALFCTGNHNIKSLQTTQSWQVA